MKIMNSRGAEIDNIVRSKGGALIGSFVNMSTKVKVRCGLNHEWDVTPGNIKLVKWCPHCSGRGTRESKGLELIALIVSKGGTLLSPYVNSLQHVKIKCQFGHEWETTPANINSGHWCHSCSGYRKDFITILSNIAIS